MTNSSDPDQLASSDLHCLLRQGMSYSAREGLMLSMLGKNFTRQDFKICFLFFQEDKFQHFMQTVSGTISMKCQNLFLGEIRKYHHLFIYLFSCLVLSVKLQLMTLKYFFFQFSKKTGFNILGKLSPV